MNTIEWLISTYEEIYPGSEDLKVRPRIKCNDGFSMSVQASYSCYCEPRYTLKNCNYTSAEIGFPSEREPLIIGYAEMPEHPTDTVYPYTPIELIDAVIKKHGGIVGDEKC